MEIVIPPTPNAYDRPIDYRRSGIRSTYRDHPATYEFRIPLTDGLKNVLYLLILGSPE